VLETCDAGLDDVSRKEGENGCSSEVGEYASFQSTESSPVPVDRVEQIWLHLLSLFSHALVQHFSFSFK